MQRQLSNGRWINEKREQQFTEAAATLHGVGTAEITARLNDGEEIKYCADAWYAHIRIQPATRKRQVQQTIRCDCGHSVPQGQAMTTAQGTSCPRCYDRMSN